MRAGVRGADIASPSRTSSTITKARRLLGLHIISNRANHRYGFPKQARLLRSAEFRRVYDNGRRRNLDFLLAFVLQTGNAESRIGLTVSRAVGGSVQRNRVKRRLREVVRKHLELLGPGWDVVFNARPSANGVTFAVMEAAVKEFFQSLRLQRAQRDGSVDGPKAGS